MTSFKPFVFYILSLWFFGLLAVPAAGQASAESRLSLLQKEWQRDPANLRVALVLAGALRRGGEDTQAHAVVKQSMEVAMIQMEEQGSSPELEYMVGTGALFIGEDESALQHFQIALSLEPEREEIHLGMVRASLNLDRIDEAQGALELAGVLFPENPSVKSQLAEVYERTENYEQALPLVEELCALRPEDEQMISRLLSLYTKVGDVEKAQPLFQQLAKKGRITELEAVLHVYRMHLEQGDLRAARIELQEATRITENHPLLDDAFRQYYSLQAQQAQEAGSHRRALLFLERALERSPDHFETQYRLAQAHAILNNHEEALEHFLPLLEKKPANPHFYADLTDTLLALERWDASVKVLQLGLKLAEETQNQEAQARLETIRERITREWPAP